MGDFIAESIISAISAICCIMLLNRNWFARQKLKSELEEKRMKYKFNLDKKRLKSSSSAATPLDSLGGLTKYLPLLKTLDGDQIQDLIAVILGGDEEVQLSGAAEKILEMVPPEVIQGFIEGFVGKQKGGGAGGETVR